MAFDPRQVRASLEAQLSELDAEFDRSASDRATVELDQSSVGRLSRVDALQRQAMAQATERRRQAERVQVHEALARLERGEYGDCVSCGEPISPARLARFPQVATCITCASEA